MELIKFVFSDFWIWLGAFLMLCVASNTLLWLVKYLFPWNRKEKESEEGKIIVESN